MIKLSIHGFWPQFNYHDNFFKSMFEEIYGNDFEYTLNPHESNICLIGENLIPPGLDRTKTKIISHIAEPKDPFYGAADYHFTFDPTDLSMRNVRIPLWMIYINKYNLTSEQCPVIPINEKTLEDNEWYNTKKIKFCVTPFSNAKPNRIEFWRTFNSYKQTDGFGLPFGNGDDGRNQLIKYQVLAPYKFCMAYENTNKLGYVTEKILQAKTAGCIPIYWGSDWVLQDFNPNCFIYANKFQNIVELLEYVKLVDQNSSIYENIHFSKTFNYDLGQKYEEIKKQIKEMISI